MQTIMTTCLESVMEAAEREQGTIIHHVRRPICTALCSTMLDMYAFMQRNFTTFAVCMCVNTEDLNSTGHQYLTNMVCAVMTFASTSVQTT